MFYADKKTHPWDGIPLPQPFFWILVYILCFSKDLLPIVSVFSNGPFDWEEKGVRIEETQILSIGLSLFGT